jgi:hypothetical protein
VRSRDRGRGPALAQALCRASLRELLYLFDLGFFERDLFARPQDAGAHVLMRLKKPPKFA